MSGLLRKDGPWLCFFAVAGLLALVLAMFEHGFFASYVISPGRYEVLFHVAWIAGLLLGATAASFDELLGTREFLRQRPIPWSRVQLGRVAGCGLVLLSWFVLQPLFSKLGFILVEREATLKASLRLWHTVPQHWATMTAAVSACGIGFWAGSLPFHALTRLLIAGSTLLMVHSLAFVVAASESVGGGHAIQGGAVFAMMHLGFGMMMFWLGSMAGQHARDQDRPLAPALRLFGVMPALLVSMTLSVAAGSYFSWRCLQGLEQTYPEAVEFDGRWQLARRTADGGHWQPCDVAHQPVGPVSPIAAAGKQRAVRFTTGDRYTAFLRWEAPNWERGRSVGWHLRLACNPAAGWYWALPGDDWAPANLAGMTFSPAAKPAQLLDRKDLRVVVVDPGQPQLWELSPTYPHWIAWPLPDGDVFVGVGFDGQLLDPEPMILDAGERNQWVVGQKGVYLRRDEQWHRLGTPEPREARLRNKNQRRSDLEGWFVGLEQTGLGWVGRLEEPAGVEVFRHSFLPRTGEEQILAAGALAQSLLRPPLLQLAAHWGQGANRQMRPWNDALVVDGRRSWLVWLGVLGTSMSVWLARRRLQRLGGNPAAVRFWTVSIALFGPVGWLACALVERSRAYARPALPVPAPPRLVSGGSIA